MVELCELTVMETEEWPPDMDTHVANLDFARSIDDSTLFSSSLDPQAISTDSLDTSLLHRRCANNKDDYRLTLLEESTQWTGGGEPAPLTTWGRIRSVEPLDETTASLPAPTRLPQKTPRPQSLLANFQEQLGRFVDVNENEISEIFPHTSTSSRDEKEREKDRWKTASRSRAPKKRTFAQLSGAPHLDFLALPHQMPNLCEPSLSLGEAMARLAEGSLTTFERLPCVLAEDSPDSGLGSSGPSHIEDWPSLAVLLPKEVVEACSFFKSHSRLLSSNSIERSTDAPCRTCFGVRRRLHPPRWAHSPGSRLCDCAPEGEGRAATASPSLHTHELSIVGLPVYSHKRKLVESAVEGAAEVARGGSLAELVQALTSLLSDGLHEGRHPWEVIVAATAPGPATNRVHAVVKELDSSEKSVNSRVETFFHELLREGLVDCWLCYVSLKESSLRPFYAESAFLPRASSAYHSLLCRLVESLQLLTLFPSQPRSLCASRLPSDSRVPKSSSMPARLSSVLPSRRSRIPRLSVRPRMSRQSSTPSRPSTALVLRDSSGPGQLAVSAGESVRVLSLRGPLARVCRSRGVGGLTKWSGVVPSAHLSIL